jgi:hypothetical protein
VLGGVEMFGGVAVGGAIATSDVAAGEAEAQVDPRCAYLQAILAALGGWRDLLYLFYMFACHSGLLDTSMRFWIQAILRGKKVLDIYSHIGIYFWHGKGSNNLRSVQRSG